MLKTFIPLLLLLAGAFAWKIASAEKFCRRDVSSLKQLIVVFRHGDRSPIGTFPNDIHQEDSWPFGWGELTPNGMARHFLYGSWTRTCYRKFLNETLSTKRVYARSTDFDRTLMSAQAYLSGAYPPKESQIWGQEYNIPLGRLWQPFPVHTEALEKDTVMKPSRNCPRLNEAISETFNKSKEIARIQAEDADILRFLGEKSGLNKTDWRSVVNSLSDAVIVELQNNRKLVDWLHDNATLINKLHQYMYLAFEIANSNPEVPKLSAGPLLREIGEHMTNRSKHNAATDFEHIIYSGHDTTVAPVLAFLGDYSNIYPPYASSVIFEIHEGEDGSYGVLVFYRNSSDSDPFPVIMDYCKGFRGTGCLISDFVKFVNSRTAGADCRSSQSGILGTVLSTVNMPIILGCGAGIFLLCLAVLIGLRCKRRRSPSSRSYQLLENEMAR